MMHGAYNVKFTGLIKLVEEHKICLSRNLLGFRFMQQ